MLHESRLLITYSYAQPARLFAALFGTAAAFSWTETKFVTEIDDRVRPWDSKRQRNFLASIAKYTYTASDYYYYYYYIGTRTAFLFGGPTTLLNRYSLDGR